MGRFSTIALLCLDMLGACGSHEPPKHENDIYNDISYDFRRDSYESDAGNDSGLDINDAYNSDAHNPDSVLNDAYLSEDSDLRDVSNLIDQSDIAELGDVYNDQETSDDADLINDTSDINNELDLRDTDLNYDINNDSINDSSDISSDTSNDTNLELDALDIETEPEDETRILEVRLFNTVPLDLYDGGNPNLSVSGIYANGLLGYEINEEGITLIFDNEFRGDPELTIEVVSFSNFTSHRMRFEDDGVFHDRDYLEVLDGTFRMFVPAVPLIDEDFLDYVKNMMNVNESRGIFRYQGPDIDASWIEGEPQSTWSSGDIVITRPMPLYLPPELNTHRTATENAVLDINDNSLEWYVFVDEPFDERFERGVRVYSADSYRYIPMTDIIFNYGESRNWYVLSSARVEFIENSPSQESVLEELMHSLGGHPEPEDRYNTELTLLQKASLATEASIIASSSDIERLYDMTQLWIP